MRFKIMIAAICSLAIVFSACSTTIPGSEKSSGAVVSSASEIKNEALEKERYYYDLVEYTIDVLRERCVVPASLEINDVIVVSQYDFNSADEANHSEVNDINIYVDYSAENKLGNSKSGYAKFIMGFGSVLDFDVDDNYSYYYKVSKGRSDKYEEVGNGLYKAIDESVSFKIVFKVDLTDYDNQGYIR